MTNNPTSPQAAISQGTTTAGPVPKTIDAIAVSWFVHYTEKIGEAASRHHQMGPFPDRERALAAARALIDSEGFSGVGITTQHDPNRVPIALAIKEPVVLPGE